MGVPGPVEGELLNQECVTELAGRSLSPLELEQWQEELDLPEAQEVEAGLGVGA